MYKVYIAKVKNIRPAINADRLNLCEVFGNTTVVDKSVNENDLYVYFPVDGKISQEFGEVNNLFRKKDSAGNSIGGFIDPDKRNIKAINIRGNRSDGLVLPLSCLETFGNISNLKEGDEVSVFNGHVIAEKYIPRRNPRGSHSGSGNKTHKPKVPVAPLFAEHADTEQLAYNLAAFRPGDEIEITLKMHGTSQRTAYLPVLKKYKRSIFDRILRRQGKPIYDWGYVSGTRRTVLEDYEGGYYGSNAFREAHSKFFEGKLYKGEAVYYEVVGFVNETTPIMGIGKVPKEYQKQYGKEMTFHYGCSPTGIKTVYGRDDEGDFAISQECPQSDIYVYRMTMTNEEGFVVEYTPDFMRYRCEQMGVKTVPVFFTGFVPEEEIFTGTSCEFTNSGEWVKTMAEQYYDGPDPIGKTHVREGVVVRIINRPNFTAYKHKNYTFKLISGIIAESVADSNDVISNDVLEEL